MPVEKDAVLKALDEVRKFKKRGFSQSIDLIFNLADLDLKKPENRLNETVDLPHSPKNGTRIVVFATGDLATRAKSSGADQVMGREELDSLGGNKKEVKKLADSADFFIAETTMMAAVGKVLGPVLGPRGKMPTPVPPNAPIENVVARHNRIVRVRVRDQLNVQCRIGSEDMPNEELADNIEAIISRLEAKLPKGLNNVREIGVKTTMGPFVKIRK
ncbi:50S ribosomal protein L1 [Candidatus Bathyarchaeota archaeon]|nr:50S ribosomal protein L1 [Candidatus Bathyarchaeota archaeon]